MECFILISTSNLSYDAQAQVLAKKHGWQFVKDISEQNKECFLLINDSGLHVQFYFSGKMQQFRVDFLERNYIYRLKKANFKNELLAKAMSGRPSDGIRILDATAGWGRDSMMLAWLGFEVTSLEAASVVYELLQDGLTRAGTHQALKAAVAKIHLIHENAESYLQNTNQQFDIIYLDPMFPQREKSAAVKLNMQLLQHILGEMPDEESSERLLLAALHCAKKRIVVKRPRLADALGKGKFFPHYSLEGRSSRFDVYLPVSGLKKD